MVCTFPAAVFHLNDRTSVFFPSALLPDWLYAATFILVVTPFATNPLLYVVSDPNYKR